MKLKYYVNTNMFLLRLQESFRFVDNANQVMMGIGRCIASFTDPEEFKKAWVELTNAHCPYQEDKHMSKQHHFKVSLSTTRYGHFKKQVESVNHTTTQL